MPSRRIKSLTPKAGRPHREHRSKRGRKSRWNGPNQDRVKRYKLAKEKLKLKE